MVAAKGALGRGGSWCGKEIAINILTFEPQHALAPRLRSVWERLPHRMLLLVLRQGRSPAMMD